MMIRISGSQIHAARVLAGLSREALANRADLCRQTVIAWENSSNALLSATYSHLCRAVDVLESEGVQFLDGGVCRKRPATPAVSTLSASEGAVA
jgi:transcriptional regulator with XRE-family HTH domain